MFLCLSLVITVSLSKLISFKLNIFVIILYKSLIPSFFNADIFTTYLKLLIIEVLASITEPKSDLFNTTTVLFLLTTFNMSSSSLSSFLLLSIITIHKSASFARLLDFSIPIFSISLSVSLIPAVSISFKGIPLILTNSSIVSRVVPSYSVTIALSSFNIAFNNEDFPAFGLPIIAVFIPSFIIFPLENDFSNFLRSILILSNLLLTSLSSTSSTSYSG